MKKDALFIAIESRNDLYQTCMDAYSLNHKHENIIEFHSSPFLFFEFHIKNILRKKLNRRILKKETFHLTTSDFARLTLLFCVNLFSALIINSLNILRLKPPEYIFNLYVKDQSISYLLRNQPLSATFYPNKYIFLRFRCIIGCLFSFVYMISLARYLKFYYEVQLCIVSHDIYHFSALTREFSRLSVPSVIPLKTPYSYTIPINYEYAQFKLPPFLSSLNERMSRVEPSAFDKAREYLERRIAKDNTELFYLEHSAYRKGNNNPLIRQYQEKRKNFYVLYLHSFTDDHHRYGYDQFDSIWDWTVFILDYFKGHPEKTLFVKTHPNTTEDSVHFVYREDYRALTYLQKLYSLKTAKNIHFLPSTFSNSHIITNESFACVISHHGNIAVEALSVGLPTITSEMSPFAFCNQLPSLYTWNSKSELYAILDLDVFRNYDKDPLNNPCLLKFVAAYYLDDNLETKRYYIKIIHDFIKQHTNLLEAFDDFTESKLFNILTDYVLFLSKNNHPLYKDLLEYLSLRINRSNIV